MIQFCYLNYRCGSNDIMSCPELYFDVNSGPVHIDFRDYSDGDVIFGGGGLIHRGFDPAFQRALRSPLTKTIMWGAGLNYVGDEPLQYPRWLDEFKLVGLRDFGNPYNYVPCASCMHPLFDEFWLKSATLGVVAFEHFNEKLCVPREACGAWIRYPTRHEFHHVIETLSSAAVVITNSYHACYYSMLLGKPVVCFKPWGSKFATFKHQPVSCDETNWESACIRAIPPPHGYLDECRALNIRFRERVVSLLHPDVDST